MQKVSTKSAILAASALAALVAVPALSQAQGGPAPTPSFQAEKCYGISAAGKNDCGSAGNNSCAGTAKTAGDKKAWIYVPVGTCAKIQGASLKAS